LVFAERDELFDVAVSRSLDRKIIFFGSFAKTASEQRFLASDNPAGEFRGMLPRQAGHEYDTDHYEGRLYIRTNKGAKNFRVVSAPLEDPSEARWTSFIDANPAVKIESMTFFARHGVVNEREGGLSFLPVIDRKRGRRTAHDQESDYALALAVNPEYTTRCASRHPIDGDALVRPTTGWIRGSGLCSNSRRSSANRSTRENQARLGHFSGRHEVPYRSCITRGSCSTSGTLLLCAYGSYGISCRRFLVGPSQPARSRFIYALAYVRGGGELGEEWRERDG
jgi:oligopeptidase B